MLFPQDGDKEVNFDGFISLGYDNAMLGILFTDPLVELINEDIQEFIQA